jgi:hypothetical protein
MEVPQGDTEVAQLWKYIHKLEYLLLQCYKEKVKYKKTVKEKLRE